MAGPTLKLKLVIAYHGGHFSGWQTQATGQAVQPLIEAAWRALIPGKHNVHGASRTDAGVHAMGMVAHVELPRDLFKLSIRKVPLALNARLPDHVRVVSAHKVPNSFHARYHAVGKQYRYTVWNHPAMHPLLLDRAWHVPKRIQFEAVQRAARLLVGTHDFRSFAANHPYRIEDTVRTLHRVDVRRSGPLWTFIIEGDAFLYKMCRGIVGTLVQVGNGRFREEDVKAMLEAKNRTSAGMSAPACGLVLWKVNYPKRGEPVPDFSHRRNPRKRPEDAAELESEGDE